MLSWGSGVRLKAILHSYIPSWNHASFYAVTIMTESYLGALALGHGTELHRQHEHRQQHRDTSSDISLSHYLYMLHLCYTHCIWFPSPCSHPFLVSQAVWGSVISCATTLAAEEMMSTHTHTQQHAISSKPSCNATSVPWRQISLPLYKSLSCPLLSPSLKLLWLSSHQALKLSLWHQTFISISMPLSKLPDFL